MRRAGGLIVWTLFVAVLTVHAEDRHGCRYRRTYETGCENDIRYQANFNPTEPVCLNEIMTFLVPQTWIDQGARYQEVIVYRHPEICPPVYIDHNVPAGTPQYGWRIWCEGKVVAQGAGPEASCKAVTNKVYTCEFVTSLDRKCAPTPSTSWVSRSAVKLDVWGIWTNVFLGTNLQLRAEGKPPYVWKSRDAGIASVDQEGLVTGVKTGRTTIMVWDANQCYRELLVKVLDMDLMPDVNRDRVIGEEDRGRVTPDKPFRFWINDDRDFGDISDDTSDIPGAGSGANYRENEVNGRSDLLDFFPLWLDIRQVVNEMYPGDGVRLVLRQGGDAAKAVYTDLLRGKAGQFLVQDNNACGPEFNQASHGAGKFTLSAGGVDLLESFLSRIRANPDKGVLMVEGAGKTAAPISLEAWKGGTLLCRKDLPIRIDGVEKMYRWINLRSVTGGEEARHTHDGPPDNYPDAECNGKQVVFVHGFNTSEEGARGWNAEIFKRLFWSGSRAMFTAVTWQGDETPGILPAGAYYHADVINAFQAAPALVEHMASLPGEKYLMAHSLGNMLASSAIVDNGLNPARYFMIDAAVAMEAYKASERHLADLALPQWHNYTNRAWASEWYRLFNAPDGRNRLTWRGRFGNIPQALNYYSSGEDVLDNNELYEIVSPIDSPERVWVFQEQVKGGMIPAILIGVDSHGGWGFNPIYRVFNNLPPSASVINELSEATLRTHPAFKPFDIPGIFEGDGSEIAKDAAVLGKLLAEAIPATSRATGRNNVDGYFSVNTDMMTLKTGWPRSDQKWLHSDFKNVAFPYSYGLFEDVVIKGGLK